MTRLAAVVLDGAAGEGGGQILRTALSLSLVTGRSFRIERIRANRDRPGLQRQHLAAVRAAAQISRADVAGDSLHAATLEFAPHAVRGGTNVLDVGSAGSTTLVLQTVVLPLCLAGEPSDLTILGGTHNTKAPPFEYIESAFVPAIRRMGARVEVALERPGFYPAGGGRLRARIEPVPRLEPLALESRGDVRSRRGRLVLARLPMHIAEREREVLLRRGVVRPEEIEIEATNDADGPGNAVALHFACDGIDEVFSAIGRRGVPAEHVADEAAREALDWLASGVPVGPHLADQLLLPLALAGGGSFRTVAPTAHATTNAAVVEAFLPVRVAFEQAPADAGAWRVRVSGAQRAP